MNPFSTLAGGWSGTCAFRLMPSDALAPGASTATATAEADGWGWCLRYSWTHPDDGVQHGTLLLGSPAEEGGIQAAWLDSWHCKPELRLLTGSVVGDGVHLEMTYEGWGWTIDLRPAAPGLSMVMNNVIPPGHEGFEGAYVVMDAAWR